jgi:hypothetical protein
VGSAGRSRLKGASIACRSTVDSNSAPFTRVEVRGRRSVPGAVGRDVRNGLERRGPVRDAARRVDRRTGLARGVPRLARGQSRSHHLGLACAGRGSSGSSRTCTARPATSHRTCACARSLPTGSSRGGVCWRATRRRCCSTRTAPGTATVPAEVTVAGGGQRVHDGLVVRRERIAPWRDDVGGRRAVHQPAAHRLRPGPAGGPRRGGGGGRPSREPAPFLPGSPAALRRALPRRARAPAGCAPRLPMPTRMPGRRWRPVCV